MTATINSTASASAIQRVLWWATSKLNAEVEVREDEREGKWAVSLQPASTKKLCEIDKWTMY